MADYGARSKSVAGATIIAPEEQNLKVFQVGPLTNNTYPLNLFGETDVTGWTAYFGPPGSTYGDSGGSVTLEGGGILFVRPDEGRSIFRRVFPGS